MIEGFVILIAITFLLWFGQKRSIHNGNACVIYKYRKKSVAIITNVLLFAIFTIFIFREINNEFGGMDAVIYRDRFMSATGSLFNAIKSQDNEIGYGLLVYVVRLFTNDFRVFLLIYYILLLLLINNINKNIVRSVVSLPLTMIFISTNIIVSLCLMRNQLSCFLAFNSILYMIKNKKGYSFWFLLTAISCHISAIFVALGYCLFYVCRKFKLEKFSSFIFFLLFSVVALFSFTLIEKILAQTKYSIYFTANASGEVGVGQLIRFLFVIILFFFLKDGTVEKNARANRINLIQVYTMIAIMPLQLYASIIYRMFSLISYSQQFLLSNNFNFGVKRSKKQIFILCVYIFMILEIVLFFNNTVPSYGLFPLVLGV